MNRSVTLVKGFQCQTGLKFCCQQRNKNTYIKFCTNMSLNEEVNLYDLEKFRQGNHDDPSMNLTKICHFH